MTFPERPEITYGSVSDNRSGLEPEDRIGLTTHPIFDIIKRKNKKVRNSYTIRSYGRNQNIVRHTSRTLGPIAISLILTLIVALLALIYVTQGTKATGYDYDISRVDSEIAELQAQKEDLAVEQARLTSVVASENSSVAANMASASPAGYASE